MAQFFQVTRVTVALAGEDVYILAVPNLVYLTPTSPPLRFIFSNEALAERLFVSFNGTTDALTLLPSDLSQTIEITLDQPVRRLWVRRATNAPVADANLRVQAYGVT